MCIRDSTQWVPARTATCRASFGLYNTRQEVDILAQALRKAQEFLS